MIQQHHIHPGSILILPQPRTFSSHEDAQSFEHAVKQIREALRIPIITTAKDLHFITVAGNTSPSPSQEQPVPAYQESITNQFIHDLLFIATTRPELIEPCVFFQNRHVGPDGHIYRSHDPKDGSKMLPLILIEPRSYYAAYLHWLKKLGREPAATIRVIRAELASKSYWLRPRTSFPGHLIHMAGRGQVQVWALDYEKLPIKNTVIDAMFAMNMDHIQTTPVNEAPASQAPAHNNEHSSFTADSAHEEILRIATLIDTEAGCEVTRLINHVISNTPHGLMHEKTSALIREISATLPHRAEAKLQGRQFATAIEKLSPLADTSNLAPLIQQLREKAAKGFATCTNSHHPSNRPAIVIEFKNLSDAQDCYATLVDLWGREYTPAAAQEPPLPPIHEGLIFPRDAKKIYYIGKNLSEVIQTLSDRNLKADERRIDAQRKFDHLRRHAIAHQRDIMELMESILSFGRIGLRDSELITAVHTSIIAAEVAERGLNETSSHSATIQGRFSKETLRAAPSTVAAQALKDAAQLLVEISRNEVNATDEAIKWVKAYPEFIFPIATIDPQTMRIDLANPSIVNAAPSEAIRGKDLPSTILDPQSSPSIRYTTASAAQEIQRLLKLNIPTEDILPLIREVCQRTVDPSDASHGGSNERETLSSSASIRHTSASAASVAKALSGANQPQERTPDIYFIKATHRSSEDGKGTETSFDYESLSGAPIEVIRKNVDHFLFDKTADGFIRFVRIEVQDLHKEHAALDHISKIGVKLFGKPFSLDDSIQIASGLMTGDILQPMPHQQLSTT